MFCHFELLPKNRKLYEKFVVLDIGDLILCFELSSHNRLQYGCTQCLQKISTSDFDLKVDRSERGFLFLKEEGGFVQPSRSTISFPTPNAHV